MKQMLKNVFLSLIVGAVVPYLFLSFGVILLHRYRQQNDPVTVLQMESAPETSISLPVRVRDGDNYVSEMDMDTYLVGVLLAEMPASFEPEALKAQSCVARTYARKAYVTGGKHGDGSVCMEPSCCQGYSLEEAYFASGGTEESVARIRSAVDATSGYVLTYGGDLIDATYFSCSGGRTEDAVAVWGRDFPYLQAVDSPGEERASHYTDTEYFSSSEFTRVLELPLIGDPASWLGMVTYTEGGGVHTMIIGEQIFTGVQLRNLLGLRSTAFSMTADDSGIFITTRGYGHRVGMSQYGADAMAQKGSQWREILEHYYTGVEITLLS